MSLPLKGTSETEEPLLLVLGFTTAEASLLPLPCLLRGTSARKSLEDESLSLLATTASFHWARGSVAHKTCTCNKNPTVSFQLAFENQIEDQQTLLKCPQQILNTETKR